MIRLGDDGYRPSIQLEEALKNRGLHIYHLSSILIDYTLYIKKQRSGSVKHLRSLHFVEAYIRDNESRISTLLGRE